MQFQILLGDNKAISALTFENEAGQMQLGALIRLPTSFDPKENKTYYKAIGIKVPITDAQRIAIIHMLGGTHARSAADTGTQLETGTTDRKMQTLVEAGHDNAGSSGSGRTDEKSRT
jgi:hypothetical protein